MAELRSELPPLTKRIARLPLDHRGYPVPWFVEWVEGDGPGVENLTAVPIGQGRPDFRIMSGERRAIAHREGRCWVCGEPLGRFKAFLVGPMCAVNRTSAEPPSHRDCAEWSAVACPFLTRPHARRRDHDMPEEMNVPGYAIKRNPGVALVWVVEKYRLRSVPNGVLFDIGEPVDVGWYAEGREATRAEVMESIESGLPALQELADAQAGGSDALAAEVERAMALVPA